MLSPGAPTECTVLGTSFVLRRGVFSPAISRSTEFFARQLVARCRGKSVIEIGCGCGAIAVLCALHGATRVVATDINKIAVQCARENVLRYGVGNKITVIENEFANVPGTFDIVFFALPYVYVSDIGALVERFGSLAYSVFDPNYLHQKSFFRQAPAHINQGGVMLAGFGGAGDVKRLMRNLKACNLKACELAKAAEGRSDNRLYLLQPMNSQQW